MRPGVSRKKLVFPLTFGRAALCRLLALCKNYCSLIRQAVHMSFSRHVGGLPAWYGHSLRKGSTLSAISLCQPCSLQ